MNNLYNGEGIKKSSITMSAGDPPEFNSLSDNNVLLAFAKVLENAKEVINEHPPAFFHKFVNLGNDINRFSRHINNSGLRKVYFHIGFMQTPLKEYLNYDLRNRLINVIDSRGIQSREGATQITRSLATDLTVKCISDVDGRNVIDIDQFWRDLSMGDEYDEQGDVLANKLLSALDEILDDYVQEQSSRVIEYIDRMLIGCGEGMEKSNNKWYPLLATTSDIAIELDEKAISWRRI